MPKKKKIKLCDATFNADWFTKLPDDKRSAYEQLGKELSGPERPVSGFKRKDEGLDDLMRDSRFSYDEE